MELIIDISRPKNPCLILKQAQKAVFKHAWHDDFKLSETLIGEIDKMLKKNKTKIQDIKKIQVIDSSDSIVSTRIARAVALGLKAKI